MSVKQKAYNIKVFSLNNAYIRTINPNDLMSDISFTSQISWGQWELAIRIRASITSWVIAYNQIIRVYESDTINTTPILIYSGIVGSLKRISDGSGDYIEARIVGLASMLAWIVFQQGGVYTFTKAQELATTQKNIIDYFSTIYPGILSYTGSSVENTGVTTTTLSFDNTSSIEAIKLVENTGQYWWTIDANGLLQYHPKNGAIWQLSHNFTFWENIDSIDIDENIEELANRTIVKWTSGVAIANDAPSQAIYGIRESYESYNTWDITSANVRASSNLSRKKDLKRKICIIVNDNYNIETIRPGDLATVRNFDYTISALQIQKIEYNADRIKIELEWVNSFFNSLI